jgi:hypothetical protein
LRIFEKGLLRRTFGADSDEIKREERGDVCITRSFVICSLHQILLGSSNQERKEVAGKACDGDQSYIQNFG